MKHLLIAIFFIGVPGYCQDIFEGFYMFNNGNYMFYEKRENVLKPGLVMRFNTKDTVGLGKNYSMQNFLTVAGSKKVKASKNEKITDTIIYVDRVVKIDTIYGIYEFKQDKNNRITHRVSNVDIEGFYCKGFENSSFYDLKGDVLKLKSSEWVSFDDSFYTEEFKWLTHRYPSFYRGMYMKAKAIKQSGKPYGYGRGGADALLTITEIITIDTTRTLQDYVLQKAVKSGYYKKERIPTTCPRCLRQARTICLKGIMALNMLY